ncbi:unnamed protein product [marine sediment metagenome]|uniref:Uncharacterized protein n=1 Tax=marine sediment metagenome TaxID=412755 RepID=X1AZV5_9ZZZZ
MAGKKTSSLKIGVVIEMNVSYITLNRTGVRRLLDGMTMTPDAFGVLERHTQGLLGRARKIAEGEGKRRISGIIMRRVVR